MWTSVFPETRREKLILVDLVNTLFMGLETKYIGNNEFSLETKFVGWKQWNEIENTNSRLETYYAGVYFLVQKSVWRSSLSRDELASKMRSWSRFLFRTIIVIINFE